MIWWILFFLVAVILLIVVWGFSEHQFFRYRDRRIFLRIFRNKGFTKPTIIQGYLYGYHTIELKFYKSEDFIAAQAQGLIQKFETEIGRLHGSRFDPKRAITYKHSNP